MGFLTNKKNTTLGRMHRDPFSLSRAGFDDYLDEFLSRPIFAEYPGGKFGEVTFTPMVDMKEKDGHITISAELPGLTEDDIEINLEGDHLIIEGEKRSEEEKDEKGRHYSERSFGYFRRNILLPYEADQERASAKFDKGVLKVELEKLPEAEMRGRRISIKS